MTDLRGGALRDFRGEVAMIFQDPRAHINPVRSIGDFITEALRTNRGVSRAAGRARAVAALADVGIDDGARRLGQYPHELSGGLLQRVMIAAALLTEPRLILADEPTTALDVTTQAEVMAILNELRSERGLALLFITHDLDLAGAVCDRTCVMYAGEVVESQSSRALSRSVPATPTRRRCRRLGRRSRARCTAWRRSGAGRSRLSKRRPGARSRRAVTTPRTAVFSAHRCSSPWMGVAVRCLRADELGDALSERVDRA